MFTRLKRRDEGETLLEVLVALVILGVAAVAIVGAMTVSVKVSDIHRKQATAAADVRDYAESIESQVNDPGATWSSTGAFADHTYDGNYVAKVISADCYVASSPPTWATCSGSNDVGVQRLTLQVASPDNRAVEQLVIVVREPCALGGALC